MRVAKEWLSGRGLGRKDLKVELRVGQRCCVREAEVTMGNMVLTIPGHAISSTPQIPVCGEDK